MSQIIWNLVRKYEPDEEQVVVSSLASDELWQLAFVQADAKNTDPTLVRILAGLLPPITEAEKKKVVRLLRGTDKPMHEALAELELPHQPTYVEKQIRPHLVWDKATGAWNSVTPAGLGEVAKNFLHLPKS